MSLPVDIEAVRVVPNDHSSEHTAIVNRVFPALIPATLEVHVPSELSWQAMQDYAQELAARVPIE